ncbi:MAG: hypothetical protein AAF810_08965 [Cyanobacteria bacterium P01_D01_bin.36]
MNNQLKEAEVLVVIDPVKNSGRLTIVASVLVALQRVLAIR